MSLSWLKWTDREKPQTQFRVGCHFFSKRGKHDEQAVHWLTLAARSGVAAAHARLGWCHEFGRGMEISLERAFGCYCLGATMGDPTAQWHVARCFEYGVGVDRCLKSAERWLLTLRTRVPTSGSVLVGLAEFYQRSARPQEALAILQELEKLKAQEAHQVSASAAKSSAQVKGRCLMARIYLYDAVPRDVATAARCLELAAAHDAWAAETLGCLLWDGVGVPRSLENAINYFRFAAASGRVTAKRRLGQALLESASTSAVTSMTKAAVSEAIECLKEASSQGDSSAWNSLGCEYERVSTRAALRCFSQGAIRGNATAMHNLATLTFLTDVDATRHPVYWWRKALANGESRSGWFLWWVWSSPSEIGHGISKREAWHALEFAAHGGCHQAQLALARQLREGDLNERKEALRWYLAAAANPEQEPGMELLLLSGVGKGLKETVVYSTRTQGIRKRTPRPPL